jgi:hypothetical protein
LSLFIASCSNPAGGGGNSGGNGPGGDNGPLTGIDADDFGASAVIAKRFNVSTQEEWNQAVNSIRFGSNNKNYIITLTGSFDIPSPYSSYTFGSVTGITVSLRGANTLSLSTSSSGNLLGIGDNQTLVLRESTLRGKGDNTSSLVYVSDSSFKMHSGEISGNTATSGSSRGSGVYVSGGSFTMSGGKIFGNTANATSGGSYGGGVYVSNGGFTMSGGEISNNTASASSSASSYSSGGGVYISSNGSFMMSGGKISNNTASATSRSSSGGGVYITGGNSISSSNFSFTMSGGAEISGNTATSD